MACKSSFWRSIFMLWSGPRWQLCQETSSCKLSLRDSIYIYSILSSVWVVLLPFSFLKLPKNPRTKSNQTFKRLVVLLPFSFLKLPKWQKTQEQNQIKLKTQEKTDPGRAGLGRMARASTTQAARPGPAWPRSCGQGQRDLGRRRDRPPWRSRTRPVLALFRVFEIWNKFGFCYPNLYNRCKSRLKDSISSWFDVEKTPHQIMKIESFRLDLRAKIVSLTLEMLKNKLVW